MTHTPGPWRVVPSGRSEVFDVLASDVNLHVCRCDTDMQGIPWPEANARLIAAAPDALDALRDLLRVIATDELIPESVSYMQHARAAIAKAEGV